MFCRAGGVRFTRRREGKDRRRDGGRCDYDHAYEQPPRREHDAGHHAYVTQHRGACAAKETADRFHLRFVCFLCACVCVPSLSWEACSLFQMLALQNANGNSKTFVCFCNLQEGSSIEVEHSASGPNAIKLFETPGEAPGQIVEAQKSQLKQLVTKFDLYVILQRTFFTHSHHIFSARTLCTHFLLCSIPRCLSFSRPLSLPFFVRSLVQLLVRSFVPPHLQEQRQLCHAGRVPARCRDGPRAQDCRGRLQVEECLWCVIQSEMMLMMMMMMLVMCFVCI